MKRNLAFGRVNFILLGISVALVIIGFILMSGDSSTAEAFNPDIFSSRRIIVAPILCLFGFLSMIVAVMYRKKDDESEELELQELNKLNSQRIEKNDDERTQLSKIAKTTSSTNDKEESNLLVGGFQIVLGVILLIIFVVYITGGINLELRGRAGRRFPVLLLMGGIILIVTGFSKLKK